MKKRNTGNIKSVQPDTRLLWWIPVLLLSAWVFADVGTFEFILWDDDKYVTQNPMMKQSTWAEIFTIPVAGNYHPLTMLSLKWDYQFGKGLASTFHKHNAILHVANALLVYILLLSMGVKAHFAAWAGILFGVHPLHVESVAWVSERKDVLYTFFLLCAWLCWKRYTLKNNLLFYVLAFLLMAMACLSKGMALVLPFLLALDAYLLEGKSFKFLRFRLLPFFLLSLLFVFVSVWAQRSVGAIRESTDYMVWEKIVFPFYGFWFYLEKMVAPLNLSAVYPYPLKPEGILPLRYMLAMIPVLIVCVAVFYFRKNKIVVFAFLGFTLCILPVLQILPVGNALTADRYFYVSSLPLFIGMAYAAQKYLNSDRVNLRLLIFLCIPLIYVYPARQRVMVWKNTLSLFSDVVKKYPQVAVAHYNMGIVLNTLQQYVAAEQAYRKAVAARPDYADAWTNLGVTLQYQDKYAEAIEVLNKAVLLNPQHVEAHNNLGVAYERLNNTPTALIHYRMALSLNPDKVELYNNVGFAHEQTGRLDSARWYYEKALSMNPEYSTSMVNMGNTLLKLGHTQEEANEWFMKAARLGHTGAQQYLGQDSGDKGQ